MNEDDTMHGTMAQHLGLLRRRETALSLLTPPHHGTPKPEPEPEPQPASVVIAPVPKPRKPVKPAKQWKLVCLREVALPFELRSCETPAQVRDYFNLAVKTDERWEGVVENFIVLMLNTRRRVTGHKVISQGTLDTILVHPREVFRPAIIDGAAAIIIMHNHPSGDPTPSEADVKVTRDLIRAGQLLKIEVLDHIIMGQATIERPKEYSSLRELGYFYT